MRRLKTTTSTATVLVTFNKLKRPRLSIAIAAISYAATQQNLVWTQVTVSNSGCTSWKISCLIQKFNVSMKKNVLLPLKLTPEQIAQPRSSQVTFHTRWRQWCWWGARYESADQNNWNHTTANAPNKTSNGKIRHKQPYTFGHKQTMN